MVQKSNRRSFFKSLAAIIAAPVVARVAADNIKLPATNPKQLEAILFTERGPIVFYDSIDVTSLSDMTRGVRRTLVGGTRIHVFKQGELDRYTGLPVTPNGGNIAVPWPDSARRVLDL